MRTYRSLLLLFALVGSVRADGLDKQAASLAWTPDNVAQYSVYLRGGEQWQAIRDSKAWAKLTGLPLVKELLQKLEDAPGKPLEVLKDKKVQDALALVGDLCSREICLAAGDNFADTIVILQQIQFANQFGPVVGLLRGETDQNLARGQAILRVLNENRDKLNVPDVLYGFRAENAARAAAHRKQLDAWLEELVEHAPFLKGGLKKVTLAGTDWTTLTIDTKMVPWDDIPWNKLEDEAGEFKALVDKLKQLKLTLAVGTRDDFVVLTMGKPGALARTQGDKRLLARAELAPATKFADRKLTSLSYTSKALAAQLATTKDDVEGLVSLVESGLEKTPLTKEERQKILKDVKELAKEMKAALPEPGAALSFSFDTTRGGESYSYDWTSYPSAIEAKPLTILQHVGGDPLFAYAAHQPGSDAGYKTLVKWVKLLDGYVDDLVLPKLEEEQAKQAKMILDIVRPFGKQIDEITRQKWLPAVKDGQMAFVFDARLKSKNWLPPLGATEKALPLPEPVIVLGVTDAEKLIDALSSYRKAVNEVLKIVGQFTGQDVQIPPAKETKTNEGVVYSYPLAEMIGGDERFRLSAAIGAKAAAFGISTETTQRLIKATPFKGGGPLAKAERPLLSASYLNGEGFFKALGPWAELVAERVLDVTGADNEQRASIQKQVATVMEVLTVFRSSVSATYREGKATVTHSEAVIRDLDK